jgi:O-antigen/teichoic acid export membrane protein
MKLVLMHLCSNPTAVARALAILALLIVLVFLIYRDRKDHLPFHSLVLLTLGAAFVLSPTVMPWYIVPILPLAVIARRYLWFRFSAFVCLAFAVMIDGSDNPWVLLVEWGAFAVLAYLEYAGDKKQSSLVLRQAEPEGAL